MLNKLRRRIAAWLCCSTHSEELWFEFSRRMFNVSGSEFSMTGRFELCQAMRDAAGLLEAVVYNDDGFTEGYKKSLITQRATVLANVAMAIACERGDLLEENA